MKIAITADPMIPVPPQLYGGIERIIDMLIRGLTERGHDVTLFAHSESAVACRLVPYPAKGQGVADVLKNTLTVSRLLAGRYDLVHSFGRLAYLSLLLPTGLPKLMSYQREPTFSQVRKAVRVARKGSLWFTGCSEYIAAQIRPYAPSFAIPNGVPLETYTFTPRVAPDAPLVFLGRLEHIKGPHVAIEVAQRSGRSLIIAGNVPDDEASNVYFATRIQPHLDGKYIQYIGPVNDAEKNALLGSAYAFLMPILWNEPFGIVMAEALACGTPVIGFGRGAVPEVVQHGVNGFLASNPEDMAAAVSRAGQLSRKDCRLSMEQRFSDKSIVEQYEALYNRILKRHPTQFQPSHSVVG